MGFQGRVYCMEQRRIQSPKMSTIKSSLPSPTSGFNPSSIPSTSSSAPNPSLCSAPHLHHYSRRPPPPLPQLRPHLLPPPPHSRHRICIRLRQSQPPSPHPINATSSCLIASSSATLLLPLLKDIT